MSKGHRFNAQFKNEVTANLKSTTSLIGLQQYSSCSLATQRETSFVVATYPDVVAANEEVQRKGTM